MRKVRFYYIVYYNLISYFGGPISLSRGSGFRVYIKNHDYIAVRYLVCVNKMYDTFCGNEE